MTENKFEIIEKEIKRLEEVIKSYELQIIGLKRAITLISEKNE